MSSSLKLFIRGTVIVVNGLLFASPEVRVSPRAMMVPPRSRATIKLRRGPQGSLNRVGRCSFRVDCESEGQIRSAVATEKRR